MPRFISRNSSRLIQCLLFATASVFLLIAAQTISAQTFSSLSGTVTDSTNAVIPGATIVITNTATSLTRTTQTSSSGAYSFPNLQAGTYSVRVSAPDFQTELSNSVKLDAAAPVSVQYQLHISSVKEAMEVEPVATELDRTSSSIGDTFSEKQVENLPINGRDYGRLTLLTPGAVLRGATIADITFDGLGEEGGYFYLDGVDATRVDAPFWTNGYERGARLMNGSIENVAEFRVQANGYQPEYGRSAGGMVNIISKSGTSRLHGEAYDFFRNESFDARNFFARTGSKPRFRFNDYGANLGGPLLDKKTFFFANYEGNSQHIGVTDQATVLSSTSRSSALNLHPELAPLIADYAIGIDSTANPQIATVQLVSTNNVNENTGSFRLDHQFSNNDSMFARYTFNESLVSGPLFTIAAAYYGINAKQIVPTGVTNIALHEQHIFNPHTINDALVGFERFSNSTTQSEPIPLTVVTGLSGYVGGPASNMQHPSVYQYGDTLTLVRNTHTLKLGGTAWRTQENRRATPLSEIVYTSITNFINNNAFEVIEGGLDTGHHARASEFGMFAQDNWQILPNLVLNYGLRWDISTTAHDAQYNTRAYNQQTGALFPAGHEYYPVSLRDVAPRVGVAYSPNARTVVRAGGGMFYRDYPIVNSAANIPANTIPANLTLLASGNPGLGYPFTSFTNGTTPPPGTATVYGFPQYMPDLYTIQYNLSVQQEITRGVSTQLAYIGLHGVGLDRTSNVNLFNKGVTARPNPNFGDIYLFADNGFLSYNSLQAIVKANIKHLTADINYGYSHAIDNACDAGNGNTEPQDYNNIIAERANGCSDVRHILKYNVLYALPIGLGYSVLGSAPAPVRTLVSGWSLNSLGILRSGVPLNILIGTNTYGNGNAVNQRPNLVAGQNLYVPHAINANGYKNFLNPSAWAIPSAGTFGNSPRNPVFGPTFKQVDASIVKHTPVYKEQELEFRVEMFNVFNHPNFAPPGSTFAPGSLSFGELTSTFGSTLGFGAARQLELAMKYKF